MKYPSHSIVVTGLGCILPKASDIDEYWKLIESETVAYSLLPETRWQQSSFMDAKEEDYIPSFLAGWVKEEALKNFSEKKYLRSERMVLEALRQAKECARIDTFPTSTEVVLGCMNLDEEVASALVLKQKGYENQSPFRNRVKHTDESYRSSSLFNSLNAEFQLPSNGLLVDTACSSSLTAIDLAMDLLLSGEKDCVVTGGVEASLGPETYLPFAKLGVLSKGNSIPFDKESDGIVQAEGAVVFILERATSAIKRNAKIYGVLTACEGIATAKHSHLLSPDFETQKELFRRVNSKVQNKKIHYIEAHATGTRVGDLSELMAAVESVKQEETCPVGSVKTILGHTKGAAGAASLLKVLLSLEKNLIAPSSKINSSALSKISPLSFIKKPTPYPKDETLHVRVNSGGFGGSNYQLAVEKCATYEWQTTEEHNLQDKIVTIARSKVNTEEALALFEDNLFQIPPKTALMLDEIQKSALVAVNDAIERSLIHFDKIPAFELLLIYAAHTGGGAQQLFTLRSRLKEMDCNLDKDAEIARKKIFPLNEDTPGTLDSMTTGRLVSEFGFRGAAFHLDAEFRSQEEALRVAKLKLNRGRAQAVIVVTANHKKKEGTFLTGCPTVSCEILSLEKITSQMNWKQM